MHTAVHCFPGKLFAVGLEPAWLVQSDGMHGPINVETAVSGSMAQILGSPCLAPSAQSNAVETASLLVKLRQNGTILFSFSYPTY